MREATTITGPLSHILNPRFLHLPFDVVYAAISEATENIGDNAEHYGVKLWSALAKCNPNLVALDQTIDRLPPEAFGKIGNSVAFTVTVKEWATYKAPNLANAYFVLKARLLEAGWKPSQVNVHLMVGLHMEEMMFGEPHMNKSEPSFDDIDINYLTERERRVFEFMRANPAFA